MDVVDFPRVWRTICGKHGPARRLGKVAQGAPNGRAAAAVLRAFRSPSSSSFAPSGSFRMHARRLSLLLVASLAAPALVGSALAQDADGPEAHGPPGGRAGEGPRHGMRG